MKGAFMENEMSSQQDTEDDLENFDYTPDVNEGIPREKCPIISIVRGDYFWPNLVKIENSQKALHILRQLRTRNTAIEKNEVPYRVLNHSPYAPRPVFGLSQSSGVE